MIKVVHLCSSPNGGAGIAAIRLHEILNNSGQVNSRFLHIDNSASVHEDPCFALPHKKKKSFVERLFVKLKLKTRKRTFSSMYTNLWSKGKYEIISFPESSYETEVHPYIHEADIVHLHWISGMIDYSKFFRKVKKPIIWTLHDMNPFLGLFHYMGDFERNSVEFQKVDLMFRNYKIDKYLQVKDIEIVCLSDWMYKQSVKSIFKSFRHHIIPNGIESSKFGIIDKGYARDKIGVERNKYTVLIIAENIDNYRKGSDILFSALNEISIDINLMLVGTGEFVSNNNRVVYNFGKVNDSMKLNLIYSAADILIIPSREDNLPNVMLESFFCGTPVLSFCNGGMRDHIIDGVNGYLMMEMNSKSIINTLVEIITNNYKFTPSVIRDYALNNFSENQVFRKYFALYDSVLANK